MSDRVPNERLGTSRSSHVFLKIYLTSGVVTGTKRKGYRQGIFTKKSITLESARLPLYVWVIDQV